MSKDKSINWPNLLFLTLTPALSPFALYWWINKGDMNIATLSLFAFMFCACGISITAGYHRLFAHRSYEGHWLPKLFFLIFGGAAFQGSALVWSLDHRNHHRYVDDNEKDPYSINKGFWFAHIIWLFYKADEQLQDISLAPDLAKDKLVVFQHKYYVWIAAFFCFGFPTLLAASWGDALGGFLIAGLLRVALNHQFTFLINSACHMFGEQTYSDGHSAKDSWINALVTFGEGYHNYHHEFASDYRNGIRWYDFDPTKWLIWTLSKLGLANDLKRVSMERIVKRKMEMQQKLIERQLADQPKPIINFAEDMLKQAQDNLKPIFSKVSELQNEYKILAKEGADKRQKKTLRMEIKAAEAECKKLFEELWESAVIQINARMTPVRA